MTDPESQALEAETITWLSMARPGDLRPTRTDRSRLTIRRVDPGQFQLGRTLYMEVGKPWRWVDRRAWPETRWRTHYSRAEIRLWSAFSNNRLAGYFELESHGDGSVELAYFGLLPEFTGTGLGGLLLTAAVEEAWRSGARRVWVHTSSRDHAHALPNYLARGLTIDRTETRLTPTITSSRPDTTR